MSPKAPVRKEARDNSVITLVIGLERKVFNINRQLLVSRSDFFKLMYKSPTYTRPFSDSNGKRRPHQQMIRYLRTGCVPRAPHGLRRKDPKATRFSTMLRQLYSMARGYMMRDLQNKIIDELRLHHWRCKGSRYSSHLEEIHVETTIGNPLREYYVVGAASYLATAAESRSRRRGERQAKIMSLKARNGQFRSDLARVRKVHGKTIMIDKLDHRDPTTFHPCVFHEHKEDEICHLMETSTRTESEEESEESGESEDDSEGESAVGDVSLPTYGRRIIDLTGASEESSVEGDADEAIDQESACGDMAHADDDEMDMVAPEMTWSLPSPLAHDPDAGSRPELAVSPKTPRRFTGEDDRHMFRARAPSAESVIRREMGRHVGERVFAWVDAVRHHGTDPHPSDTHVENSAATIYQSPLSHPRARSQESSEGSEGTSAVRHSPQNNVPRVSFTYDQFKQVIACSTHESPSPPSAFRNQSRRTPYIHRADNPRQHPDQTPGSSSQMAIEIEDDDDELDLHRYCLEGVHPDRVQYLLRVSRCTCSE